MRTYRFFKGQKMLLDGVYRAKQEAQQRAAQQRKRGRKARVTAEPHRYHGQKWYLYLVWTER